MGILGTMAVHFTANLENIKDGTIGTSAEVMAKEFKDAMQILVTEKATDINEIETISQGILDIAARAAVEGAKDAIKAYEEMEQTEKQEKEIADEPNSTDA